MWGEIWVYGRWLVLTTIVFIWRGLKECERYQLPGFSIYADFGR